MKKLFILILVGYLLALSVSATELTAPPVPSAAADVMPDDPETFSDGVRQLIKAVISKLQPELAEASGVCLSIIAAGLMISILQPMTGHGKRIAELCGSLSVATILLAPTQTFINLGVTTINELLSYGKLLLPVMTAGLAAQGGVTKSAALYTGTAVFNTVLGNLISALLVPAVYIYLALSVANCAVGEQALKKIRDLIKWCGTWVLKLGLYIFTAYMGFTGVITGTADAAAVKVTKSTISVAVPVIGNILSDASETVLVSAGMIKNAAGIYGALAILAICLAPFARIGVQYLLLKLTSAVCSAFSTKQCTDLIEDFSVAMGMLVAATGTIGIMQLISIVCFMKGMT